MVMDVLKLMAGNARLIVLPRYLRWLKQNGNQPLIPNDGREGIGATILKQMIEQPRVRSGSFSASSAGQCERAQMFGYLAAEAPGPDPQLAAIFEDGKWRHLRWQACLLQAGILADIEVPLMWKAKQQRGTMDGLGIVPDDHNVSAWRGLEFGFELKGVSAFQFESLKKAGPMEKHLDQVARYFLLSGLQLFSIVYENKSTQEPYEWVVSRDDPGMAERIEDQRDEVERLLEHTQYSELPAMLPECAAGKGAWKTCSFGGPDGVCKFSTNQEDIERHKNRP